MGIAFSNVYVDYYLLNKAIKKRREEELQKKNDNDNNYKIETKKIKVSKKKCCNCFG